MGIVALNDRKSAFIANILVEMGPIIASQLSSHIYLSTYKIWKQSDKDLLNYCVNDDVSAADAA